MKRTRIFALLLALLLLCGCGVQELVPLPEELPEKEPVEIPEGPTIEPAVEAEPEPEEIPEEVPEETPEETPEEVPEEEPAPEEPPAFPEDMKLACKQAFVYDLDNDEVFAMKGKGEQLYPASITKLLTIMTALEYLEPDTLIRPSDEQVLVAADSSIAYVNHEHILTAEQLIEGMLLPSGNDAACALAAKVGRTISGNDDLPGVEAVDVCVGAMNDYAASIGMAGSHFTTVDGYMDENHYTTVEDMMTVSVLAAKNELVRRYCGRHEDPVVYESGHTITWLNTNKMLDPESEWYDTRVTGMKTGSLSGHFSLVCTLEQDGRTFVAGVFTGQDNNDRYGDMTTIVNWLFGGE